MEDDGEGGAKISVNVKFKGTSISLSISPDSTIKDLKTLLQPLTNVLPRGQKLIFNGTVLIDTKTLKSLQISDGSKLMLMASYGLHQGDGPITKDISTPSHLRRNPDTNQIGRSKTMVPIEKSRSERWRVTGVVALSECHLKVVPEEVWVCGPSVRVLDISNNFIQEVPAKIGSLRSIQKLFLNANGISDESINWEGLASLKSLTMLSLSQNHLTRLPPVLGDLIALKELHVSKNKLTSLPLEIGLLSQLQVLDVSNNRQAISLPLEIGLLSQLQVLDISNTRITSVPPHLGNCCSLIEVNFSSNLLVELPETFGNLQNLKTLHLGNNGVKSLPSTLFKKCLQLSTLNLHNTEITMDLLRQFEGWEDFDGASIEASEAT